MTTPDEPGPPPGQPFVSPDDLASIPGLWAEQIDRLLPVVAQVYRDSAGNVHAGLIEASKLPDLPGASSIAAETHLAQVRNLYEGVGDDLWANAQATLTEGFKQGESIDQLSARLRAVAPVTARNAELIARSTVIEASNAGSIATARATGLDMRKQWIETHDARTRPTHRAKPEGVGGTVVDLNAKFVVGGFEADAPGDPMLPPAEKYRCRCTIGYVFDDDDRSAAHEEAHQQTQQDALPNTSAPESTPAAPSITDEQILAEARAATEGLARDQAADRIAATQARILAAKPKPRGVEDRLRWEQARKDVGRDVSTALAQLDELSANGASERAMRNRMRSLGIRLHPDLESELTDAAVSGDRIQVEKTIDAVAQRYGLTRIGAGAGQHDIATDPALYEDLSGRAIPAGTPVDIMRPGYSMEINGQRVTVLKALADRAGVVAVQAEPTQSAAEILAAERRAQRQAARETSRAIEAAKPYAEFGAHVQQTISVDRDLWTPEMEKALNQQVDYLAATGATDDELAAVRRAIATRDADRVARAASQLLEQHHLTALHMATERLPFDQATMEGLAQGVDIADGATVQVVRPGYNLQLPNGGQLPALTRSIVRPVTAPPPRGSSLGGLLKSLVPDENGDVDEALAADAREALGKAFEGKFAGFTTEAVSSDPTGLDDHSVDVIGYIFDANGRGVGGYARTIHPPFDGQPGFVDHVELRLNRDVQGSGFAAQFNAKMFDQYRQAGLSHVTIHANIDVGGYAWASQGFDFATEQAAATWNGSMQTQVQFETVARVINAGVPEAEAEAQIAEFKRLLDLQRSGTPVSAFTFSQVGRPKGKTNVESMWIGKLMMLGSEWDGVMPL